MDNSSTKERRQQYIVEYLREKQEATLLELSSTFSVSTVTIRKDVINLEQAGLVYRRHGSVMLRDTKLAPFFSLDTRFQLQNDEKMRIACAAVELISSDDSVILDSGTTVAMVARKMANISPVSVATNSILAAQALSSSMHHVTISGGEVINQSLCITGTETVSFFSNIRARKLFLGTTGICESFILTTGLASEAEAKKAMIAAADEVILVVDSSKLFHKANSMFSFCTPEQISYIVTGEELPEMDVQVLKEHNIKLIVAN